MNPIYAIYELVPSPRGDNKRLIVIRERKEDCEKIKKVLEKSNIDFELYIIEELKRK